MPVISWISVSTIIGMIVKLSTNPTRRPRYVETRVRTEMETEIRETCFGIVASLWGTIIGSAIAHYSIGAGTTLFTLPGLLMSTLTTIALYWIIHKIFVR